MLELRIENSKTEIEKRGQRDKKWDSGTSIQTFRGTQRKRKGRDATKWSGKFLHAHWDFRCLIPNYSKLYLQKDHIWMLDTRNGISGHREYCYLIVLYLLNSKSYDGVVTSYLTIVNYIFQRITSENVEKQDSGWSLYKPNWIRLRFWGALSLIHRVSQVITTVTHTVTIEEDSAYLNLKIIISGWENMGKNVLVWNHRTCSNMLPAGEGNMPSSELGDARDTSQKGLTNSRVL